jgi:hypothetical protein
MGAPGTLQAARLAGAGAAVDLNLRHGPLLGLSGPAGGSGGASGSRIVSRVSSPGDRDPESPACQRPWASAQA